MRSIAGMGGGSSPVSALATTTRENGRAVLLTARDGQVVLHRAYGESDPLTGKKMETSSLFRICSQSKAITSTAAMILWERGILKLDDPVSQYIPEFANLGLRCWLRGQQGHE